MDWLATIKGTVEYIESNLTSDIDLSVICRKNDVSPFYLQKGFAILTGYTLGEYVRNRRLCLSAFDVIKGKDKIIDIAYKYGYETPESFTKAFTRFHSLSPHDLRKEPSKIKIFLPLQVSISIKGGNQMDYIVEEMKEFSIIGYEKTAKFENSYKTIPLFWKEFITKHCENKGNETEVDKAIRENSIGMYGVCLADNNNTTDFKYIIAGPYKGGKIPEGMKIYKIKASKWAKFKCVGPLPEALQSVNTKIFEEWIPGNPDYDIADPMTIECYAMKNNGSKDDVSFIWIPIKNK